MIAEPSERGRRRIYSVAGLLRDARLVLPGAAISLAAFALLVPLFSLSIATLIVWIGAFLLPLALLLAGAFARLSRARVRQWGAELPEVSYRPRAPGIAGRIARIGEPRRWLDLAYEGLIALPLRLVSFVIAIVWIVVPIAGLTYGLWGGFLPAEEHTTIGQILTAVMGGRVDENWAHSFGLDAAFNALVGLLFAVTLPLVMRGLARSEAAVTRAALGGARTVPQDARAGGDGKDRLPASTGDGWTWILVSLAAVAMLAVSWPVFAVLHGASPWAAMLVSLLQAAALLLAVRVPAAGIALQTAGFVATVPLTATSSPWPWPVTMLIAHCLLVLVIALRRSWPWAIGAWLAPQLGVFAAASFQGLTPGWSAAAASLVVSASVTLGIAVVGAAFRAIVASRGALRIERQANAHLSAQRREIDERTRIAQELHDVVAHGLSVISVQATTAVYRHPGLDQALQEEFSSIAQSSRQALSEMRGLLALLRSSDGEVAAPLAPQPTLDDVGRLVETTRQSGARIDLRVSGTDEPAAPVPPLAGLAAYRIVQEALSNAVRHAPGSVIAVEIGVERTRLVVDVRNGPQDPSRAHTPAPGAGLGLAGAAERAQALGGVLRAGPLGDGFLVNAVIPLV
ncbi:sensor histidine kinase [Microbacterium nanhaiense]|uniref:histidine kinase n=1 Tax=Microbacterium nanhaiense TaxID=1301026 RepID=A0ABQ2N574_9MICO|nr:sensor histidine kinase [Microbacterium nanhaiense]GGO67441.1 sensor histidine kinase [Microbacterium nanhaiense]